MNANLKKGEQENLLAAVEKRRSALEQAVNGVVKGFTSALFVWGPPGLGKSHMLTMLLDACAGKGWRHHTAYSTPKALVLSLAEDPTAVHLFEDCERLLKTDLSASILRAACGSPNDRERWITYETANERLRIKFSGGIIIATNADLKRTNGPMQGVASRFRPIRWDMSLKERIATIMKMSERSYIKGGQHITAKEAKKVADQLIEMVSDSHSEIDLDLRLYAEHALPAYAQAKADGSMKWTDLLYTKLVGVATSTEEGQAERTRRMEQLAQKIDMEGGPTKDKIAKWKALTGLGQAIYYRHLRKGKKKV